MTDIRQAVTRMTLDLALQDTGKSLACTKGDVNRRLEFTLQDGGKPFYVPRGWTAFLGGIKPDGTRLYNGCVIERGIILYDFASGPEISTCAGIFPITVDLFDEEGEVVASPAIWLHVKDNGRDLASEDQFTYLQDLLGRLHEAEGEIDQLENTDIGHASQISTNAQSIGEQGQRIEENSRVLLGHAALLKEINDKLDEETGVNEETVREIVTGELAQYDTSGAVDGAGAGFFTLCSAFQAVISLYHVPLYCDASMSKKMVTTSPSARFISRSFSSPKTLNFMRRG